MNTKNTIALWGDLKDVVSDNLHVSHEALHVAAGLLLYPLFTRWMKVPAGSWRPLLPIAALEIGNEAVDFLRFYVSHWPWTPGATIVDITLTLAPPAALAWFLRRRRSAEPDQIPQ